MNTTTSYLISFGVCCGWPAIVATLAVFGYRRYQIGGWRAVFFGTKGQA